MLLGQLDIFMQKIEVGPLPIPYTKMNLKRKKISRKSRSFVNFGLGDDFLCKMSKMYKKQGKKNLYALKGTIK